MVVPFPGRRLRPMVPAAAPQFTADELRLILDALLDARLVLQAIAGGTLIHPFEPPLHLHDLAPEITRVEAALLLVGAA